MKEIFKDIKGYEGLYQISNLGRVKSLECTINNRIYPEKILQNCDNGRGYFAIRLCKNGSQKTFSIHRLVATTFIPNPNNYKEVNHIDSDTSNNCVNNLQWCDRKTNIQHMVKHQNEIKERNERRIETLETIYYGIELGQITTLNQVKTIIDEDLLNEY